MKKIFSLLLLTTVIVCCSCDNNAVEMAKSVLPSTNKTAKISLKEKMNKKISEMSEVAELGTVEYTITKIVKAADDPKWYKCGDRKILFECKAYLKAGVNLAKLDASKVEVNEDEKSVIVTLPHAELLSFDMPPHDAKLVYENVAMFRSKFSANDRNHLLQLGEKSIRDNVPEMGILQDAEKNAATFFKAMLLQLGFESVTVKFA